MEFFFHILQPTSIGAVGIVWTGDGRIRKIAMTKSPDPLAMNKLSLSKRSIIIQSSQISASIQKSFPHAIKLDLFAKNQKRLPAFSATFNEKSLQQIRSSIENMLDYLNGDKIRFVVKQINMDKCSEFQQTVLNLILRIPRGKVCTYQILADYLGYQHAVRAVARAITTNQFPLAVPCHRIVCSDRTLGGYYGGMDMKSKLLEMEGIQIENQRIPFSKYLFTRL